MFGIQPLDLPMPVVEGFSWQFLRLPPTCCISSTLRAYGHVGESSPCLLSSGLFRARCLFGSAAIALARSVATLLRPMILVNHPLLEHWQTNSAKLIGLVHRGQKFVLCNS